MVFGDVSPRTPISLATAGHAEPTPPSFLPPAPTFPPHPPTGLLPPACSEANPRYRFIIQSVPLRDCFPESD